MYSQKELKEFATKTLGERYKSITVDGFAIFAEQVDRLYSLYLPARIPKTRIDDGYYLNNGIYLICSDIEEYQCYGNKNDDKMLLLKCRGKIIPIFISTFMWLLDEKRASERLNSTQTIANLKDSEIKILEEFKYLGSSTYMAEVDGKYYLINYHSNKGASVKSFISVEPTPLAREFKVREKGVEYFCFESGDISFGPAAIIEEIPEEEYPVLNEYYIGYFSKDEDGYITDIYVVMRNSSGSGLKNVSYKIVLNKPAKEAKFLKRLVLETEPKDGTVKKEVEIWGITYVDGDKEIITQVSQGLQYKISYSDLAF